MAGRTLLALLDLQEDLVGAQSQLPHAQEARRVHLGERVNHAIAKARAGDGIIAFVRLVFSPDYRECSSISPLFAELKKRRLFQAGSTGAQIWSDIDRRDGDLDIVKRRVSPYYGTELDLYCRQYNVHRIVLAGVSTNGVVQSAVRESHDRDLEVVLLEDACCAMSASEHTNALRSLRPFCTLARADELAFD